ncbi:hypothetical protein ADIS_2485 [Lunatimonas lonarensis]|uniref:Uncharacterized protein n=1 Tax=Lunatimonas lonarensis TaxID=1232681 RepID=R7ZSC3_9BACT|nr:hypothetical protein ADIS_2485 [Lunatimonas lonarensis]
MTISQIRGFGNLSLRSSAINKEKYCPVYQKTAVFRLSILKISHQTSMARPNALY